MTQFSKRYYHRRNETPESKAKEPSRSYFSGRLTEEVVFGFIDKTRTSNSTVASFAWYDIAGENSFSRLEINCQNLTLFVDCQTVFNELAKISVSNKKITPEQFIELLENLEYTKL